MDVRKFGELFYFQPKSRIRASAGQEYGEYPFYTSSPYLTKKTDNPIYSGESLIFGTGGSASIHFENQPFTTSSECLVAVPASITEINPKYVYYYLIGNIRILENGFKGVALQHIGRDYIEQIDIPIRPKKIQDEIVIILDRISNLILRRVETIHTCDDLGKSIFINNFGDPAINPKNYPVEALRNYVEKIQGGLNLKNKNETRSKPGQRVFLKQDAVTKRFFDPQQHKVLLDSVKEPDSKIKVEQNDLLISRKNTKELVGAAAFVFDPCEDTYFPDTILRLHYTSHISGVYLYYLFNDLNFRRNFEKISGGTMDSMSNISQENILKLQIPYPPFEDQMSFEKEIHQIREYKLRLSDNLNKLNQLLTYYSKQVFENNISLDIDFELDVLIESVDLERRQNDLNRMKRAPILRKLVDRISNASDFFEDKETYDKAAKAVLQLLHEEAITQNYDQENERIKLQVE